MSNPKPLPKLVYADQSGNIYDHPELTMLCRKGSTILPPNPGELIPLPEESELFLLPDRKALGLNPNTGEAEYLDAHPVAAFVSPGHTLSALCAFYQDEDKDCPLPLFSYAALGFANDRFYVCAQKVDQDKRQVFSNIAPQKIEQGMLSLLKKYPQNRLFQHLSRCALTYFCPAAKNLALGRFEAPLPTARHCNARCLGCISKQEENSGFPSTQDRITFRPSVQEILEVMQEHAKKEKRPIFSFGQGCEGEPLLEHKTICQAVKKYRQDLGPGTININTNASLPNSIPELASAGLSSIRVSLNSTRPEAYMAYYRPQSYSFEDVKACIARAKENQLFVSLNLLYFPGITDSEEEISFLTDFIADYRPDFIQLRNLNLDPELYLQSCPLPQGPAAGLKNFIKRLKKEFSWLSFGYFNPYLEE